MPEPRPAPTLPLMTPPAAADTPPWEESAPAPRQPEPPAPLALSRRAGSAPPPAVAPVAPARPPRSSPPLFLTPTPRPLFSDGNGATDYAGLRERLGAKEIMLAQNAELTGAANLFCLRAPPQFRFSARPRCKRSWRALERALGAPAVGSGAGRSGRETPKPCSNSSLRGEALRRRERLQPTRSKMGPGARIDATLRLTLFNPFRSDTPCSIKAASPG